MFSTHYTDYRVYQYVRHGRHTVVFHGGRCREKDMARDIQNTSFVLLIISAVVLMVIGDIWAGPILDFFGAGLENLVYAKSHFEIYLAGNIFAMLSGGMNPYITA